MHIAVLRPSSAGGAPPPPSPPAAATTSAARPTVGVEVSFATNPTQPPVYQDVTAYLRGAGTSRGRNYELDRVETGTAGFTLSNRDSRFNPENTASPYYPNLKPTRQCRLRASWLGVGYDMFVGFTKGYPQEFPHFGYDALVSQSASDAFYPLNLMKFQPGSTTLAAEMPEGETDSYLVITVASTQLPLPQAAPFTIKIDQEEMLVESLNPTTQYYVKRGQNETTPTGHAAGAAVTTKVVNFAAQYSGHRIESVLNDAGVPVSRRSIQPGLSFMAASADLAGQNVLEHIQLMAEAENGQLFVSKSGVITFLGRHWPLQYEREDRAVLSDAPSTGTGAGATTFGQGTFGSSVYGGAGGGGGNTIPYVLSGPVHHDEALISNVVRVTPDSGNTQTTSDQASIDAHFERVLEKQWPLYYDIDAKGTSEWMLSKLKDTKLRIPAVTLNGAANPSVMWPILLAMEIGQRYGFTYSPRGGGTPITRSVIVEGISHSADPSSHTVTVQLSPADTTTYWRLGTGGYSELGTNTRLSY